MKVLCFGSLNIDYTYQVEHFVQKGETLSSGDLQVFSGGKGLNQSVALAKAGVETYHAGAVGKDGLFLLRELEEAGVRTEHVVVLEDVPTGHAIIQNDKNGENCILLFGGANQAITKGQVDQVLSQFQEGDYLLVQNEVNQMPYLLRQAHGRGLRIALNPSPMDGKIWELPLELVDYFILNEIEAGQILRTGQRIGIKSTQQKTKDAEKNEEEGKALGTNFAVGSQESTQQKTRDTEKNEKEGKALGTDFAVGLQESGEKMAELLHQKYPSAAIVLTLGEHGSIYLNQENRIRQNIYNVKAADTTAAGDTFTGYFLGTILNGGTAQEAMDRAAKASAIAVTRKGASPSIPTLEEVLAFGKN